MTDPVKEVKDTPSPVLPVARPNGDLVKVTITKFGDRRVSTGTRDDAGDIFARRGDTIMVSKSVADSLEASGLAEAD